jgi:2-oxoglutarate dehydrogenase complex dehydrogenase (E1) component-like enzyme
MTRCLQTDHTHNPPTLNVEVAAPILIHGDAAFAAQGIVAEVLNLQALAGYSTGGTIHIISNNQVGFTTDPSEGRSTRYASDLAKGYDLPIVHVNADDVDACIAAVHLAIDYRRKFGRDVVVDLIGYRRFGHNEQDEPAYTQPRDRADQSHPTVRELFAAQLVAQGVLTQEQVKEMQDRRDGAHDRSAQATSRAAAMYQADHAASRCARRSAKSAATKVDKGSCCAGAKVVDDAGRLHREPSKLAAQFAEARTGDARPRRGRLGLAEALAFASLLSDGTPIRLTGQDTERGTFSHRHAELHDARTNEKYVPLQHLDGARRRSNLQLTAERVRVPGVRVRLRFRGAERAGALGSAVRRLQQRRADHHRPVHRRRRGQVGPADATDAAAPARLRRRRAGTFERAPGALPAAERRGNIRVANCSTAAQYFHLLRAQAKATCRPIRSS